MREVVVLISLLAIMGVAVVAVAAKAYSGTMPTDRTDRVVIHKWKSRYCMYCEKWIKLEKPVLEKHGWKVQVADNLPENMGAPLLSLMKGDKIVTRHKGYLTAKQIMRGDHH